MQNDVGATPRGCPMIDVHTHLSSPEFDSDLQEVLKRALDNGVERILTAGEDYADNLKVLQLAKKYDNIYACLGHYPVNLDISSARQTIQLIRQNSDIITGISEVGLDYWKIKDDDERRLQREIFGLFIRLSTETSLPLIVHSRSAGKYIIELLVSGGARKVCLHAFDGKASSAQSGVEAGYYFSIPSSITRSPQKQKLAARLPLESILLETDSPVLGPDREARNEPANIIYAAEMIAQLKKISLDEVKRVTTENFHRLFAT